MVFVNKKNNLTKVSAAYLAVSKLSLSSMYSTNVVAMFVFLGLSPNKFTNTLYILCQLLRNMQ